MQNNPPSSIDRTAIWLVVLTLCCGFLVLGSDFFFSTLSVLLEPTFLRGFGLMVLQSGVVATLAGGVGLAIGELVLHHEGCTQSMIRFLRLGRWLPFFVVWAAPIWWIRWSQALYMPGSAEPVLQLGCFSLNCSLRLLATSLITFGLLVVVSLTLRLLAKKITASSQTVPISLVEPRMDSA
jgi:hypothetical protein